MKTALLECSHCDEPIYCDDGERYISVDMSAVNPWKDEPGKIVVTERMVFHREHAEELIVALNYLKHGKGGDSLEIKYHHTGGKTVTVIGDET